MKKNMTLLIIFTTCSIYLLTDKKEKISEHFSKVEKKKSDIFYKRGERSISSKVKGEAKDQFITGLKTLNYLEGCYKKKNCNISNTDARSYEYETANKIKKELKKIIFLAETEDLSESLIGKIGRHFIKFPNGHIKEAALELLSLTSPSLTNLSSITKNILSYHDAILMEDAMIELRKYNNSVYQNKIDKNFLTQLRTGSIMVRQVIAKNLKSYINRNNVKIYSNFAKTLPSNSTVKKHILSSIHQYNQGS